MLMFTWKLLTIKKGMILTNRPKYRLWEWNLDCNVLYSNKICISKWHDVCLSRIFVEIKMIGDVCKCLVACVISSVFSWLFWHPVNTSRENLPSEDNTPARKNWGGEMSREERNPWLFVELWWDAPTQCMHVQFSSPVCRFKTAIALSLINSM